MKKWPKETILFVIFTAMLVWIVVIELDCKHKRQVCADKCFVVSGNNTVSELSSDDVCSCRAIVGR